jgi:hypothetical protein
MWKQKYISTSTVVGERGLHALYDLIGELRMRPADLGWLVLHYY